MTPASPQINELQIPNNTLDTFKTSKNTKNTKMILIFLGVVFIIALVLILSSNAPKQTDQNTPELTVTPTPTVSEVVNISLTPTVSVTPTTFYTYKTYDNQYISFKYPDGANLDIQSGIIKDTTTDTDFIGISHINIHVDDNVGMEIFYDNLGYDCDSYVYDTVKPKEISIITAGPSSQETKSLSETPFYNKTTKFGLELLGVSDLDKVLLGTKTGTRFSSGCGSRYRYDNLSIIGGTGKIDGEPAQNPAPVGTIDLFCSINNEDDFKQCYEFVNTFFDTVKRKK